MLIFVPDRIDLRRRLQQVAFRQRGYFTAQQAKDAGYTYQAQKYHVDRGNWVRVDRAVFRLPDWPPAEDDAYVRWTVWSEGRGVVSHQSAATVHGLGELDPSHVHLTMPRDFTTRNPLVRVYAEDVGDADVEDRADYRVTTPTRTILDIAAVTDVTQEQLESVVEEAESAGVLERDELLRRVDDFGTRAALRLERALTASAPS
jgi:predicted transcriptional regulator of viral defense system